MRVVIVLIEKLYRYLFDVCYFSLTDKNYKKQTIKDYLISRLYKLLTKKIPNWRYELHQAFPDAINLKRYNKQNLHPNEEGSMKHK